MVFFITLILLLCNIWATHLRTVLDVLRALRTHQRYKTSEKWTWLRKWSPSNHLTICLSVSLSLSLSACLCLSLSQKQDALPVITTVALLQLIHLSTWTKGKQMRVTKILLLILFPPFPRYPNQNILTNLIPQFPLRQCHTWAIQEFFRQILAGRSHNQVR